MRLEFCTRRAFGFTLIELMITVAIIAILASIALPSYTRYVVRARRADVQRELTSAAQDFERYYTTNARYTTAAAGTDCGVPAPTSNTSYTITFTCADTTFTLTATPLADKSQASDGTLTLTNSGARAPAEKWAS